MILPHPHRSRAAVRVALTGAKGGYGRTFLAQLALTPELLPAVLIDPDIAGVREMVLSLGIPAAQISECADTDQVSRAVAEGKTAIIGSGDAIDWQSIDVLVEACGRVGAGSRYAADALANGTHVVMVSKEVDTVAGVELAALAADHGLGYLPGDGDQPADLLRLLDWVSAVGLDIVAVGKSGEYDIVFDPATGRATQAGESVDAPELSGLLEIGDDTVATLTARAEAVRGLKRAAAADSCEMTVVASRIGSVADVEAMHYPVARIDELADIYASREEGGIRQRDGIVDVFSALRLPGEASFAGGVFAIVRTGDRETWELLRGKGHVISRDGRYACIYWPYHYMGVETPLTVHAVMDGAAALSPRPSLLLAARATEDIPAGTSFAVAGHHHEIAGVAPVMIDADDTVSAYYLLDGAHATRTIARGELIRFGDVEGIDAGALALHNAGIARFATN
ncbi:homoserine dehydrogenase [Microbacterium murale]|uniref:Homoserine dehydrogenase-like protein n=1 Tax=Microbacterium murale TaxID=1081040 RepID=A0ABU0P8X0_9MICO|nr:homoserine dehydrogenase [Microbacterium murale]MDQ0643783.1 putative homoserine dehydrogenase-like protein [Microbacterium murale]